MPAKNEASFIADSINAITGSGYANWELIVIDDHSTDSTYAIVKEFERRYDNIRVEKNWGQGKVEGLNHGYGLASGAIIKCIDADDLIDASLFSHIDDERQASFHNYFIVTSRLKKIGTSRINPTFLKADFNICLKYLISIPRCSWSFTREIGDKIFPIPTQLPFEDIWFSLIIKRYAKSIRYIPDALYYYRQNENQTYGGMLNYSEDIVRFRAERLLKVINYLESEPDNRLTVQHETGQIFREIKQFYFLLSREELSVKDIFGSELKIELLLKVILYRKFGWLVPYVQRLNWIYRFWLNKINKNS
jgi:glycosyltransferase involved in cell wall biosynthesis